MPAVVLQLKATKALHTPRRGQDSTYNGYQLQYITNTRMHTIFTTSFGTYLMKAFKPLCNRKRSKKKRQTKTNRVNANKQRQFKQRNSKIKFKNKHNQTNEVKPTRKNERPPPAKVLDSPGFPSRCWISPSFSQSYFTCPILPYPWKVFVFIYFDLSRCICFWYMSAVWD